MEENINEKYKLIGKRLNQARISKEISLEAAGNKIGVNKSTVQRWENGNVEKFKIPLLEILADFYDVNVQWLLGHDVPMKNYSTLDNKLKESEKYMEINNLDKIALIPVYNNINIKDSNWKEKSNGYTPFDFEINSCSEDKNYFYYKITNNSMNIEQGTYILIEDTQDVNVNDIILYSNNNHIELGIYKLSLEQEKDFKILGKFIK